VSQLLIDKLEIMRESIGPISIRSGCRCRSHNSSVGGKWRSAHITTDHSKCKAADIGVWSSKRRYDVVESAIAAGIRRIGPHKSFVHVDVAKKGDRSMWVY